MMPLSQENKQQLIDAARQVLKNAYCVHSNFPVGAAILTDSGKIVTGCNVESASYGGTICAERSAMVSVVSQAAGKPIAVAVAGMSEDILTPCGMCRQFLVEFNPDLEIIATNKNGDSKSFILRDLLPHFFGAADLEKYEKNSHS